MKKRLFALVITLVLLLATVIPVAAITWGQPDEGEHPNVGTLLFVQNGVGYYSCTGTMIAPRVMLTAGHCVEELGNVNDVTYVRFDEDAMSGYGSYASTQDWLDAEWLSVDLVIPHPQYEDYNLFPETYDVGVVILNEEYTPSNGFAYLPPLGFLESLKGTEKIGFEAVGYGMQGTINPFYQNDYVRYKGTIKFIEAKSMLTAKGSHSAKFTNNPGIGGGTCYGDSGGPTFAPEDPNMTVAVTSFGWAKNGNCVGNDFNFRLDIPPAQDFIYEILAEYGQ